MDKNGSVRAGVAAQAVPKETGETSRVTEGFLGSAIAALEEGILLQDSSGAVLLCNPSAERLLGLLPIEHSGETRLDPQSYFIAENGAALPPITSPSQIAFSAGQPGAKKVLGIFAPERRLTWVSVNSQPLSRDGEISPYAMVTSFSDITESKQSTDALRQSNEKLRRAVEGSIRAMAAAAEMLDPSSTGHQRRVASLATAIARKMGLPDQDVETICRAGEIHDIGKITIPAEILRTPRQLSDLEFRIVKRHPQAAYDILKDAELPSPIAGMVLQHHERIDGSGYPSGLTGKDIILGARILAVSDVVETMSSPRPYRRALGIDKALGEITKQRGILYAPDVVDACVRVIAEQGFTFE